ncbi:MAG: hypothetical protein OEX07_17115 [Gammaproteobacteria bacterium]|nr:hypothetical protein [Gammaproteobacteria bacterium]
MEYFRQINKQTLLIWSVLLSFSLLCAQEMSLHTHDLEHGSEQSHLYAMDNDHKHFSAAHFSHDTSHDVHHDSDISKVDISPVGVLKNTKTQILALALIVFIFMLVNFSASRQLIISRRKSRYVIQKRYILSPPLRAPPQH